MASAACRLGSWCAAMCCVVCFFFQPEDGIRDYKVTGVQTCALPIWSPLATIAAAHTASTMDAFVTMECHAVDFISWWQQLVLGPQPLLNQGYVSVPDAPGLGVELNEPVVKEHLRRPGYFDPATKWDDSFVGRSPGGAGPAFYAAGGLGDERA